MLGGLHSILGEPRLSTTGGAGHHREDAGHIAGAGASQGDAGHRGDMMGGTGAQLGAAADLGRAWAGGRLAASGCSLSACLCPGSRVVTAVISLAVRLLMRKTWFPREPSQHKGAHTKTHLPHVTPKEEELKCPTTPPAAKGNGAQHGWERRRSTRSIPSHGGSRQSKSWHSMAFHEKSHSRTQVPSFWSGGKSLPHTTAQRLDPTERV